MKIFLKGTLVVEGKEDASYLSNYIGSEIVFVNGFELSNETIKYLANKEVILLLDPDESGLRIRKNLNQRLPNAINVEIDIDKCNRGSKTGVAECQIDEILDKLHIYVKTGCDSESDINVDDLFKLGLSNNKSLRNWVCEKLDLGNCNAKTLYKRLKYNNVKLKDLCEIIKEYNYDN